MNIAETARKALEILDKDGWNKGSTDKNSIYSPSDPYKIGSHCAGGAWGKALGIEFHHENTGQLLPLIEMIREQYPQIEEMIREEGIFPYPIRTITMFNDMDSTTEADVRAILEKLAARGD